MSFTEFFSFYIMFSSLRHANVRRQYRLASGDGLVSKLGHSVTCNNYKSTAVLIIFQWYSEVCLFDHWVIKAAHPYGLSASLSRVTEPLPATLAAHPHSCQRPTSTSIYFRWLYLCLLDIGDLVRRGGGNLASWRTNLSVLWFLYYGTGEDMTLN